MVKRKKYSEEFKREAVGLMPQPHANVSQGFEQELANSSSRNVRLKRSL